MREENFCVCSTITLDFPKLDYDLQGQSQSGPSVQFAEIVQFITDQPVDFEGCEIMKYWLFIFPWHAEKKFISHSLKGSFCQKHFFFCPF